MAISRVKTWADGQVLTAADLNAEVNNILNNPLDLWSPAAKAADMNGFELIMDADADSSLTADTDDRLDVRLSAVDLFRFDGTVASPVNGLNFIAGATGTRAVIDAGITGADANVGLTLLANGTGPIAIDNDTDPVDLRLLGAQAGYNNKVTDVNGNELVEFQGVASAVNHTGILNSITGVNPQVLARGGDTNVGLRLTGQGTGAVISDGPVSLLAQIMGHSNISFTATVATNALTIALKDAAGNDPSTASPCKVWVRSSTLTTGAPVALTRTSAMSIVVPSSATLGTTNGVVYRIWVAAASSDGSTFDTLCVFNTQVVTARAAQIHPLPPEDSLASGSAIGAGSTSAGTLYTSNGTTNMPIKWLGYVEITEATAGTWATAPTKVQMLGPGVPRSGDIVQTKFANTTTVTTNDTSTYATTTLTASITPQSTINMVLAQGVQAGVEEATNAGTVSIKLIRGATDLIVFASAAVNSLQITGWSAPFVYLDTPASTSSTTYVTHFKHVTNNARAFVQASSGTSVMLLQEIFP